MVQLKLQNLRTVAQRIKFDSCKGQGDCDSLIVTILISACNYGRDVHLLFRCDNALCQQGPALQNHVQKQGARMRNEFWTCAMRAGHAHEMTRPSK